MGDAVMPNCQSASKILTCKLGNFRAKVKICSGCVLEAWKENPHPRKKTMGQVSTCLLLARNVAQLFEKHDNGQTIVLTKFIPHKD